MGRPFGPRSGFERLVRYFVREDFFGLVGSSIAHGASTIYDGTPDALED